jgi:hypothetical protein
MESVDIIIIFFAIISYEGISPFYSDESPVLKQQGFVANNGYSCLYCLSSRIIHHKRPNGRLVDDKKAKTQRHNIILRTAIFTSHHSIITALTKKDIATVLSLQHNSLSKHPPTTNSSATTMAIATTNNAKRSCRPRRADRNKNPIAFCCLVLMMVHHTTQIHSCSAFSPLFTASSSSAKSITTRSATKQYKFNGAVASILSMSAKKKGTKIMKGKKKEEDHRRWLSWMSSGTLASKSRHADDVRMREAEELGGVPRCDRYSAR